MTARQYATACLAMFLVFPLAACDQDEDGFYQGYVEGEYVRIGVPDAGILDALSVSRGQSVEAGDALFALESARADPLAAIHREAYLENPGFDPLGRRGSASTVVAAALPHLITCSTSTPSRRCSTRRWQ